MADLIRGAALLSSGAVDEIDRMLERVKQEAHGKLPVAVYRRLFDTARSNLGRTMVEIGTSQGAATIALALGAKAGGKPVRILTCDPFVVGSRPRGASVEEKAAIVRRGFESFGVADFISIIVGGVEALDAALGEGEVLGLLLIDADGRIDRDLALLWERLVAGCTIVIDDIDGGTCLHPHKRRLQVDQKHRLTRLLIDSFLREGLLEMKGEFGQTGWYRKAAAVGGASEIHRIALPCYRELVYTDVGLNELSLKFRLHELLKERAPRVIGAWRRIRRRRGS